MVKAPGLLDGLELDERQNGRRIRRGEQEQTVLNIAWEGELPYRRLRIEIPGALVIDARALDAAASEGETP